MVTLLKRVGVLVEAAMWPGSAVLSRLRYARKFVVIGLVLMLPLAFVSWSYVGLQAGRVGFSSREGLGLTYLAPTTRVLDELVHARSAAILAALDGKAAKTMPPGLGTALAALDSANLKYGAQLGVRHDWETLEATITAAVSQGGQARTVYYRYSGATAALVQFVVEVGDKSNLLLDPELDSFYLMDTLVDRLPELADDAGKTVDLLRIITTGEDAGPEMADRDQYALATAALTTTSQAVSLKLATVHARTADARLREQIDVPAKNLLSAAQQLTDAASVAVTASQTRAITTAAYDAAAAEVRATAEDGLHRLLGARMSRIRAQERLVALVALCGALLAAYLFFAFYRSVTQSVRGVVAATQRLAAGDLTTGVAVRGRDELGDIAVAVNTAVERMRDALLGISLHAGGLANASTQITSVSSALLDLAARTENNSRVVAASAEEVAQQVHVVVTEQLNVSLNDFATTAVSATHVLDSANRAVLAVSDNGERMQRLATSSRDIGEIVLLISSIAEQTNLLALNATIEAAHAGDAGRGFGVVAGEVKELARETAAATQSISDRIGAIQTEADLAMAAASETRDAILQIQENQQVIAVSMEEQTIHAGGIGQSLGDAVERSTAIARDVADFAQTAGETVRGARDLSDSATELASVAAALASVVANFTV